jgi:transcriptional adapter 2-alpha
VLDRGILDIKRGSKANEKKKTKEEREISNSLKIFARFNTQEDHDKMVNSIIKERQLREVID